VPLEPDTEAHDGVAAFACSRDPDKTHHPDSHAVG
jgi:hypothetical protein